MKASNKNDKFHIDSMQGIKVMNHRFVIVHISAEGSFQLSNHTRNYGTLQMTEV